MNTQEKKTSKFSIVKNTMAAVMAVAVMGILVTSCDKNDDDKAHMNVRMTDAPANFNAVLIDIQSVEVTYTGGTTLILNTTAGIYNLLDFSNGLDTLIASDDLDAGTITHVRLILGTNNSVIVDNVSHPLSTPSAEQSGLKVQVNKTFEGGSAFTVLIDFDAQQSIVLQGNGDYKLKPVLRTIDVTLNGSVKGSITPVGTAATITATNGTDSYSSIANANGEFVVAGIPAGTYVVVVMPELPYLPVSISSVVIANGAATNLGIVAL
ncbi:MAG: DUF4382 domain-containing protein [Bacteroidia bacterium]